MAQETKFGWIISGQGCIDRATQGVNLHTCINIDERLKTLWEIEDLEVTTVYTEDEMLAEEYFEKNHKRDETGRYMVRLPFKKDVGILGISRNSALHTLMSMEQRFEKDPDLKAEYIKFIKEYLDLGHMQEVPQDKSEVAVSVSFYMPHHAVFKESSSTTKLRVVFDASRKTSTGLSLNSLLLVGPTIQKDIWSLMSNFRRNKLAFTADITKMYRQISVDQRDTSFQRILWRESTMDKVKEYELQTVTYGMASAPYLAIRSLKQVAYDEGQNYIVGAQQLLENFYVDDFMGGSYTLEAALAIKEELTSLLAKGGFDLRKWSSNSEQFLSTIKPDYRELEFSLPLQEDTTIKVLGILWHPAWDCFTFEVNLDKCEQFSKRTILSEISKIYDPLGLLGPCIIVAKMIMQQIWTSGVGWDNLIPDELVNKYKKFRSELTLLSSFKIPRFLDITPNSLYQLCGFADASESAYAAVVYLRVIENEQVIVKLLVSKTRVAPIKQVSLLRLELCAAHLLAKLIHKVKITMNFQDIDVYAFTDFTVILAWLQDIARRWKTFIANRTSKFLDILPFSRWRHVKSSNNAADVASKGLLAENLIQFDMWWNGPSFLYTDEFQNLSSAGTNFNTKIEERLQSFVLHAEVEINTDKLAENKSFSESIFKRFSSLQKLMSVIAMCRRFLVNLKASTTNEESIRSRKEKVLHITELQESFTTLIKIAQATELKIEIYLLKKEKLLQKGSKLMALNTFIDKEGIVRVGGRLQEAEIGYSQRHLIILTKNHLTLLIVRDIHNRYFHANQQLIMNILVMKYWIIGCKNVMKKCIRQCVICMRYRMEDYNQQMGNLPSYRLQPSRSFTNTGTDFTGPFFIKTWQGRGAKQLKCYIAIFVCMVTRAIHIEVVSDLYADKLLSTLHRFVSHRGICINLYSDNGRNFIGAARKLSEFQRFLRNHEKIITEELAKNEISWHIPAYSPNFGGIWESTVKSMKYHSKRAICETTLTYEEMSTTLCQIEACLNSRPISIVTMDVEDPEPLTSGHFLTGTNSITTSRNNRRKYFTFNTLATSPKNAHVIMEKMEWRIHFYFTETRAQKSTNIQINDIVLIKEDNLPPCRWLLGRINATRPGRDGLVRVVTLKTKNGTVNRSIRKLAVFLPTASESQELIHQ